MRGSTHRCGLTSIITLLLTAACGGDGETPPTPPSVNSVEVQAPATDLVVGDSLQLSATVRDDQGDILTDRLVTWGVTDSSVFSISGAGRLIALGKGTTVVSASTEGHTGSLTFSALGLTFADVSAGDLHVCARTPDGRSYCWGTSPVATPGTLSFAHISAGGSDRSCGLTATGAAYCWDITADDPPSSVPGGLTLESIAVGGAHTCGIAIDHKAYCWGYNNLGQLGTGSPADAAAPAAVAGGLEFATISAGPEYTCGTTLTHEGYCWGGNAHGQLGRGASGGSLSPVPVAGGLELTTIAAAAIHACALTAQGAAYCWGAGSKGELGDGDTAEVLAPVAVSGGLTFASIAAGIESSCGIITSGSAYCWGDNFSGQLGTGTTGGSSPVPVAVSGGLTFRGLGVLHAGFGGACGVTTANGAYCWGAPRALGTSSTQASPVPVLVARQ